MRRRALSFVALVGLAACAAQTPPPGLDADVTSPPPPRQGGARVAGEAPGRARAQVAGEAAPCLEDARIRGCVAVPFFGPAPTSLSLAVGRSAIALAWDGPGLDGSKAMHATTVGLFRHDLASVGQQRVFGASHAEGPSEVAVAALPSGGFLVAATNYAAVKLAVVNGREPAATVGHFGAPKAHAPLLAGRPDGGPLLVWSTWETDGEQTHAALLSERGQVRWRVHLFKNVLEPRLGSAVFTGDGFLVAQRVNSEILVVRVDLDGDVEPAQRPCGEATEYPQLAWNGERAFLTWADFDTEAHMRWAALDETGKRIAGPVVIGKTPDYFNPSPPVAWGKDTLVLLGGYTGATGSAKSLDLLRIGAAGKPVGKPWGLLAGRATDWRIARRGNEVIVGWLGGAGYHMHAARSIGLARVAP